MDPCLTYPQNQAGMEEIARGRRKSRIKYQAGVLLSAQVSFPIHLTPWGGCVTAPTACWQFAGQQSRSMCVLCIPSACTASSPMCRCPVFKFDLTSPPSRGALEMRTPHGPDTFWSETYKLGVLQLDLANQSPPLFNSVHLSFGL